MVSRLWLVPILAGLAVCASCSSYGSLSGSGAAWPAMPGERSAARASGDVFMRHIKHVVVIIQENRSFENFFAGYPHANAPTFGCGRKMHGSMPASNPDAPGASCPSGDEQIPLHQVTFRTGPNLDHDFEPAIIDWDNGKMDGFTRWGHYKDIHTAAYAYVDRPEVATYWDIAKEYVLADEMFPTEFGPSWTAHLTLVAGTDSIKPKLALADFADEGSNCKAPGGAKTTTVDESRVLRRASGPFPCLDQFNTMAQDLDTAGISWKYYVPMKLKAFIWSPFAAIKYVYGGADWEKNIIMPQTQVLQDIAQKNLAAVSWVTPSRDDSDHPAFRADKGPSWVASVVNAIGESSYWDSTAIVVLWDDWGGYYDNASPPQLDFRGLGIRVPCLIISAYSKRGYVSHTQYEYGSILKFIEQAFGLPALGTTQDGYTDTRANSIGDAFDFKQKARGFSPIPAKYPAASFLHEPPSNEPVDTE